VKLNPPKGMALAQGTLHLARGTPAAFDRDAKRQQLLMPLVPENRIVMAPVG
jgi:hypothetical protein